MQSPVENLPVTVFPSAALAPFHQGALLPEDMDRNRERIIVTHQVRASGVPKLTRLTLGRWRGVRRASKIQS